MSAEAARAAELLMQLAHPPRLLTYAALVRHGKDGVSIAELSIHLDLPRAEVGELLGRLVGAGLATGTGDGLYRAQGNVLREAAQSVGRAQPISALLANYPQLRSYFAHGRLTGLPPTMSDRYQQIAELFARFLAVEGVLTEDEVNRGLAVVTDDVAAVRRMLVETGWLERDRSGSAYGSARPLPHSPSLQQA